MSRAGFSVAIAFAAAACGGAAVQPPAQAPGAPTARLLVPRAADPAAGVWIDAGQSRSPGGVLAHYRFTFGDGTSVDSGVPRLLHTWSGTGTYNVAVQVEDLQGRVSRAQGQIQIRANAPTCARDADCQNLDVCRDGRCCVLTSAPRESEDIEEP